MGEWCQQFQSVHPSTINWNCDSFSFGGARATKLRVSSSYKMSSQSVVPSLHRPPSVEQTIQKSGWVTNCIEFFRNRYGRGSIYMNLDKSSDLTPSNPNQTPDDQSTSESLDPKDWAEFRQFAHRLCDD